MTNGGKGRFRACLAQERSVSPLLLTVTIPTKFAQVIGSRRRIAS